ncbi:hypothetical protein [Ureibacillus thermosphaericus]|uniref:Uncharacterized protein n=1 Tax=Ureibacillus thermosphaericus TaxID=51173 RepID=A0A840Q2Q4_URETH|nr:hypothetical protein [Ureibacillus thermosphaericus]MBB5149306.1 hypothetical protein [Ureibacillus thermosphaericus]NKZ32116.1 hypothetical protein [Ureibacillus thermosphaericus]
MFAEEHLNREREKIGNYFKSKYNISFEELTFFNNYSNSLLRCTVSLKIWSEKLEVKKVVSHESLQYLKETTSNFTQVLTLGILGFKSPTYSMIRRSLENIISFYYYKDHPIEFIKKMLVPNFKNLSINEMGDYIKQYPFKYFYGDSIEIETNINEFVSQIMGLWKTEYQNLSKFVHGSTEEYLDQSSFIEEIIPNNEILKNVEKHVNKFCSIVNTLNILFFFDLYKTEFSEEEKQFIRQSITQSGYKISIQEIFGEI